MSPRYNKVHLRFRLNGIYYSYEDLVDVAYSYVKEGYPYEQVIGSFFLDWLDNRDYIEVSTSGSTGKPKSIKIKKQAMVNSAIATGDFFNLKPGDRALHCLPTEFIAGKMMLIRAIILGLELDLVEPKSKPVFNKKKHYVFAAMVPMQLKNSLKNCKHIKNIIVGGSPVSKSLQDDIQDMNSSIYETYGMTETVTHIAAKQLNNLLLILGDRTERPFRTLPNVTISQDDRDCLIIDAPKVANRKIITNDIVKLHSVTEFEWIGRYDNVINSGGIKLYPEQIEKKLQNKILERFFITSITDETLGEKVVLVVESDSDKFDNSVLSELSTYERPKNIYTTAQFVETVSGKTQRNKTLEAVLRA